MAQTFATNPTEVLVGADVGAGAGADAVTDAGTDAVEEAGLKGSHKLSWQQASSQLVRSPVIFTKVHAAKKNQKCIRMKMSCAMQRQQTPNKQSKYHCMSKSSDVHANSYTRKENKKMICRLKDDVNIIGYICGAARGQWRHSTWRTNFFSTCVSIINEQLLKWIRYPRVAFIFAPLPLPCTS